MGSREERLCRARALGLPCFGRWTPGTPLSPSLGGLQGQQEPGLRRGLEFGGAKMKKAPALVVLEPHLTWRSVLEGLKAKLVCIRE